MDSTMTAASSAYSDIDEWGPRTPIDGPSDFPFVRVAGVDDNYSISDHSDTSPLQKLVHKVLGPAHHQNTDDRPLSARLQALAFVSAQESLVEAHHWTVRCYFALMGPMDD